MKLHIYRKSAKIKTQSGSNIIARHMGIDSFCSPTIPPKDWEFNEDVFINWGESSRPDWYEDMEKDYCINPPQAVSISANKLAMMQRFRDNDIPTYTFADWFTVYSAAQHYKKHQEKFPLQDKWVARTLLSSHSGKGIQIFDIYKDEFVKAYLYTALTPLEYELRIYIVNGKVIDYIQKKKMSKERLANLGREQADPIIKTYHNGWVFARNNKIPLTPKMVEASIAAMQAVGLDFGVVDIGLNDDDSIHVIETNSAPGMMHSDISQRFSQAIKEMVE